MTKEKKKIIIKTIAKKWGGIKVLAQFEKLAPTDGPSWQNVQKRGGEPHLAILTGYADAPRLLKNHILPL